MNAPLKKLASESQEAERQTERSARARWLQRLEQGLLLFGAIFLTTYVVMRLHSQISAHLAVERFKAALTAAGSNTANSDPLQTGKNVDFTLWSEKRVQAYKACQSAKADRPLGVLSSSLLSSVISTRRLAARPFFVLLSSTSLLEPNPRTNIRNNGT